VLAVLSVLLLILPLDNTVPDVAFRNPARDLHATAGLPRIACRSSRNVPGTLAA
jgi:hypothetical protein